MIFYAPSSALIDIIVKFLQNFDGCMIKTVTRGGAQLANSFWTKFITYCKIMSIIFGKRSAEFPMPLSLIGSNINYVYRWWKNRLTTLKSGFHLAISTRLEFAFFFRAIDSFCSLLVGRPYLFWRKRMHCAIKEYTVADISISNGAIKNESVRLLALAKQFGNEIVGQTKISKWRSRHIMNIAKITS